MAQPALHPADPAITRLTGSSAPSGELPPFEPIATVSPALDVSPTMAHCNAVDDALAQPDPVFTLIEAHRDAHEAWTALGPEGSGVDLPSGGAEHDAEEATREALIAVEPTTVPGLRAWIGYLDELGDGEAAGRAFSNIALAAERLLWCAQLGAGSQRDAELIALGAELDRLLPAVRDAYNERYRLEAIADADLAPIPAVLLVDPEHRFSEDVEYFAGRLGGEDGTQYYTAKAVERLRTKPRTKVVTRPLTPDDDYTVVKNRVPDPEAQARSERVIAAFEEWDAACRARPSHIEHAAAVARHLDLNERYGRVLAQMELATPSSLQGLAVLARAMNETSRPQLLMLLVAERLTELAKAEAAPPWPAAPDLLPTILADRRSAIADVDGGRYVGEAGADALMDRWGACDRAAITTPATTPAGAVASIEWAREELQQFGFHPDNPNGGSRLVLALLDGAVGVLQRWLEPASAGQGPSPKPADPATIGENAADRVAA